MNKLESTNERGDGDTGLDTDPTTVVINKNTLEKFFLAGIDRKWCIAEVAIILTFTLIAKSGWVLVVLPFTHLALWYPVRKDPDKFRAYLEYSRQSTRYEPRHALRTGRNSRPIGFGRGTPC
jgi:type IV secretion system protein TrbD